MATTRLRIYNGALTMCGERMLASLSENREPRYLLDQVWDNDGVRKCLEAGQWKFAMRTIQADYDPAITPTFGYRRAFTKPTDWINTCAFCADEYFREPLTQYSDEAGYWYAELDTVYIKYVSDDAAWGGDLSLWPGSFTDYVEAFFASKVVLKITADKEKQQAVLHPRTGLLATTLLKAKSSDAMDGPTQFPPQGTWTRSRHNQNSRRDRGNRGSLTG